jgi:hypothetical protein
MRYFYKKKDLFSLINVPKPYPTEQIYSALTQMITDNSEYVIDKYGRTGYLINIGDYYLFQPSELNYKNISIYDRSVPINYKHDMIKFKIKSDVTKPLINTRKTVDEEIIEQVPLAGKNIFQSMFSNYDLAMKSNLAKRGEKNWYESCGVVIKKMIKEDKLFPDFSEEIRVEIFEGFLIKHIVDSLMIDEKLDLLNYICMNNDCKQNDIELDTDDEKIQRFYGEVAKYLLSKRIVHRGLIGMLLYNGSSKKDNQNIIVLNNNVWEPALPEDIRDLIPIIDKKYELKGKLAKYIGFMGFKSKKNIMIYKVKDTGNKRSTGFCCTESGKPNIIDILNYENNYIDSKTKDNAFELCIRQEFTFRGLEFLEEQKPVNKRTVYFVDTETAIYNEFEKKEK